MVSLKEFEKFYNGFEDSGMFSLSAAGADNSRTKNERKSDVTLETIFDSLLLTLKEKNLTLYEIFEQFDQKRNGYITLAEFTDLLQTIGFNLPESKVTALLIANDSNFAGKVSYRLCINCRGQLLKKGCRIRRLGGG
jgi:Ca2+-binding EF-hand superfamily protein